MKKTTVVLTVETAVSVVIEIKKSKKQTDDMKNLLIRKKSALIRVKFFHKSGKISTWIRHISIIK